MWRSVAFEERLRGFCLVFACRYAYSEEAGDDFEEGISLNSSGLKVRDFTAKLGRKDNCKASNIFSTVKPLDLRNSILSKEIFSKLCDLRM